MTAELALTELPRPIEVREEWIELPDGCRLFARIVLPRDADVDPVPGVLEYLPYRLTDGTAHRDATHHPYLAGHGYGAVRVDMRGSGNSEGLLLDEYLPQEQQDAEAVIAWMADQPWCTGAVGMYGKSWGGFNALQVAARRPPALRAVISAYSTDDRYADDVHYMGGCLLAHEALSWATYMLGLGALPPDPDYVGDGWREQWLARLSETPMFLETWLAHQRRDAFWRQGSICEDFGALDCGVLMIGGWADGYSNGFARSLAGLRAAGVPCRGLIGPWSHAWPETAEPGPQIGFLQECVRWWDHWLRGRENGALEQPALRAWMQDYVAPATHHRHRPGRWVAEEEWPSPRIGAWRLFPGETGELSAEPGPDAWCTHVGSDIVGVDSGAWCPYGRPGDFPADQRAEDGRSLSFTSEPLTEPLELLGVTAVVMELTADRPRALVAVRLCDVTPGGESLLVARGMLNLTHREGHDRVVAVIAEEPMAVSLALDCAGHAFEAGHRVRVSLSATYWPFAWPSPEPVTLGLRLGAGTYVTLPRRPPDPRDRRLPELGPAERTPAPAGGSHAVGERSVSRDMITGASEVRIVVDEHNRLADSGLSFGERLETRHSLRAGDPLSASVRCSGSHFLERGSWRIRVSTDTQLTADATAFTLTTEVDAYEGEARIHAIRRSVRIPRDGV